MSISFIVIGKNEAKNLLQCFKSIFDTINYNNLKSYEVIYVDSNSSDNSIEIARSFKEIQIFKITGKCNAAIGRNIGAKESKGDVLFFIDGDMEIMPEFLSNVYNEGKGLIVPFVSGQYVNYYFNKKGKLLHDDYNFKKSISHDKIDFYTGGLFIIDINLWNSVDGMKNEFKKSQDIDFSLRLYKKKKIGLIRKKEIIARHYTIDYKHKDRVLDSLFNCIYCYTKGLLYKRHLFNKKILKYVLRNDYSLILLIILIPICIITKIYSFLFFYFILITIRSTFQKKILFTDFIILIIFYIIRDIISIFSFLFFYPKSNNNFSYKKVN